MCLVLFAYRVVDGHPLVVAANRDEFYARPAACAHRWQDAPAVFAGRDLTAHGTWLGVSTSRRFATVTNFSDVNGGPTPPRSRGDLTRDFLVGSMSAHAFAASIKGDDYQGFSLLVWDGDDLVYRSNRSANGEARALPPGIHALANTHLDDQWPKVVRGKAALAGALAGPPEVETLLAVLHDDEVPPDETLPDRGRDIEFERRVAPIFIRGAEYGTRASTAVIFSERGIDVGEQSFGAEGVTMGKVTQRLLYE
ncbi:MAG: NRDE family protein [Gammaproteobacteria bacterium]|nr:NRDE family protein [Gammaproteobacteria bacterium]